MERKDLMNVRVKKDQRSQVDTLIHPSWRSFIRYCSYLQHGEIEILKIQNGLPVLAEVTRKKIKFTTWADNRSRLIVRLTERIGGRRRKHVGGLIASILNLGVAKC